MGTRHIHSLSVSLSLSDSLSFSCIKHWHRQPIKAPSFSLSRHIFHLILLSLSLSSQISFSSLSSSSLFHSLLPPRSYFNGKRWKVIAQGINNIHGEGDRHLHASFHLFHVLFMYQGMKEKEEPVPTGTFGQGSRFSYTKRAFFKRERERERSENKCYDFFCLSFSHYLSLSSFLTERERKKERISGHFLSGINSLFDTCCV